jgi:hypothetical protein
MFKSDACTVCVELFVEVNEDEEKKLNAECMFHLYRAKQIQENWKIESALANDNTIWDSA